MIAQLDHRLIHNAFAFLERLVAAPTTLGNERAGQLVVAEELERLGFDVGVLWVDVEVAGLAAHAGGEEEGVNAIEAALPLVAALKELEHELNPGSGGVRYRVNVGQLSGGDWPSSVPATARLR